VILLLRTSDKPISRRTAGCIVLLTVLLIIITRTFSLTYNMGYHPDERVFHSSTNSLMRSLLDPQEPFTEVKDYPEGAYLFHLPFHFLGEFWGRLHGTEYDHRLFGRISSVFYFVLSGIVGMGILRRYLGKTTTAMAFYGAILCFSLFFIEHSRYGVGDMISLFLLLLLIRLTADALSADSTRRYHILLLAACAVSGALGAVKYPLIMFVLIPVAAAWHRSSLPRKNKLLHALILLLFSFIFFLLFSPKGMRDPMYFIRVLLYETSAYVTNGTAYEAGGLLNHIVQLVLYTLFYADFPLSLLFTALAFAACAKKYKHRTDESDPTAHLFSVIIPALCTVFFVYNLFAKLVVFRTYTSYFGIAALYCAAMLGTLFSRGGIWRIGLVVLGTAMILRGSALLYLLTQEDETDARLTAAITAAADETWNKTTLIEPYCSVPTGLDAPAVEKLYPPSSGGDVRLDTYTLDIGELCIVGAYPFCYGQPYLFPAAASAEETVRAWACFQENNREYFVTQTHPDFWYRLFGGWIHGGTLSAFTMPCNYIYYRGA